MYDSDSSDSGATRLCCKCQKLKLNDRSFGGYEVEEDGLPYPRPRDESLRPSNYLKLRSPSHHGAHSTGIGDHDDLDIRYQFQDEYPIFPDLLHQSLSCDFCSFLRLGLQSNEVRLSILDEYHPTARESDKSKSFRVMVRLSYSWEPTRRHARNNRRYTGHSLFPYQRVGLDALYVLIACIDAPKTLENRPILPDGFICALRYNITSTNDPGWHTECDDWLRLRFASWPNWDRSAKLWAEFTYKQCEDGESGHQACRTVWKRMDAGRTCFKDDNGNKKKELFLPSRLIDVSVKPFRIVLSPSELDQEDSDWIPKYTALSYCWGDRMGVQLKLTSDNEDELRDKILVEGLSPAQKDAIAVTRAMGLHYLWNDALCIIQDSPEDWESEAANMGKIYQYAAFTIVSLMSSHEESFLDVSRCVDKIEIPFKSSIKPYLSGSYNLSLDGVENTLVSPTLLNKLCDTLPSNRWVARGWTFQEQNHSLRMFFFWPGGLRFNCPCHSTLYRYSSSLSDGNKIKQRYLWSDEEPSDSVSELDEDSFFKSHTAVRDIYGSGRWGKSFLYYTWLRFATDYSVRVFGRETDMFPALWATAALYKCRVKDDYLMGIWKNDLWGFLWRFGANGKDLPHRSLSDVRAYYREPDCGAIGPLASWSWMGNRKIKFLSHTGDFCDDLDDFRSECSIDLSGFKARDDDHSRGYVRTTLKFKTKRTDPVTGYYQASTGTFENEVVVPVRYPVAKVFCALDWSIAADIDDEGVCEFGMGMTSCFLLLASAAVKGRTDGSRAALGLVLVDQGNAKEYPGKIWYRCGVFVAKPPEGWQGGTYGGLKIFDDSERETIWVK